MNLPEHNHLRHNLDTGAHPGLARPWLDSASRPDFAPGGLRFRTRSMASRCAPGLVALCGAALLAGCGSSGSSTITVGSESPSASAVVEKTKETPTGTTPTSGPLATEPTIAPGKGPAPTKLVTKDIVVGTGPEAKAGQSVTVNYVGALYKNGKVFNASWETKTPFTFTLGQGQVIKGWDQGVVGMHVGGRRELVIPAELAYGKAGRPPQIPPNSPLVFIVDLLST